MRKDFLEQNVKKRFFDVSYYETKKQNNSKAPIILNQAVPKV